MTTHSGTKQSAGPAGGAQAKKALKKRATRRPIRPKAVRERRRRNDRSGGGVQALFPRLSNGKARFGLGVLLAIAEQQGSSGEIWYGRIEHFFARPGERPKTQLLAAVSPEQTARLLTGLSHPDRVRVAQAVMTGANTHHLLREAVGLRTGPLYHHVRQLERAGILAVEGRNQYVLSDVGRGVLLVATTLGALMLSEKAKWRRVRTRNGKGSRR